MTSDEVREKLGLLPWAEHIERVRAAGRHPWYRGTGRTTRMICDALAAVSEGKRVRFAAFRGGYALEITLQAKGMAAKLGLDVALFERPVSHATVSATRVDRGCDGRERPLLFSDHHVEGA